MLHIYTYIYIYTCSRCPEPSAEPRAGPPEPQLTTAASAGRPSDLGLLPGLRWAKADAMELNAVSGGSRGAGCIDWV